MFENLMALKIDILGLTLTFYLFFLAQLNTYWFISYARIPCTRLLGEIEAHTISAISRANKGKRFFFPLHSTLAETNSTDCYMLR